jgi:hypothetical protein
MRFLTLIPVTFALVLVLGVALGVSAEDGPLVPPDDPPIVAPSPTPDASTSLPTPSPRPSQPAQTPTPAPAIPTPALPTPTPDPTPSPTPEPTAPVDPEPQQPVDPQPQPGNGDGGSEQPAAIWPPDGGWMAVVVSETLNIRQSPSLDAPIVGVSYRRHLVTVYEEVQGDPVDGDTRWYRIGEGRYVSAALVDAFTPPASQRSYDGRWVDINLSAFYAVIYDGATPIYAAIIRTGAPGYETPTGEFTIFRRVASETMDSSTLGVGPDDPDYYYIEDVKYTQYFAEGGYALHGNYWTSPDAWGEAGSHGCINLFDRDAAWFWDLLSYGSVVSIHY